VEELHNLWYWITVERVDRTTVNRPLRAEPLAGDCPIEVATGKRFVT
jgi:hypothetical protein